MRYHNPIPSSNNDNCSAILVDKVARAYELKNRIELHPSILLSINFIFHTRASNFVNSMVLPTTANSLSAACIRIAAEGLTEEIEDKPISDQIISRFSLAGWFNNQFNHGELNMEISRELSVENVRAYIAKHGGVSMVELERYFDDTKGKSAIEMQADNCSNVVVWSGMSAKFCSVVMELEESGKVEMKPTPLIVYITDGRRLDMPIAEVVKHYTSPHWLPIEYNIINS